MSAQDFLHIHAGTELCERYAMANSVCRVTTNSQALLQSVRGTFPVIENPVGRTDLSLKLWVDNNDSSTPPWPQPYVRGLSHRVFAGFDTKSSIFADLRAARISGRFSSGMAADVGHWKTTILPVLMSIVSGSLGLVELHASCVAKDGRALVLLGPSRSGKSTMAMALIQAGFQLLSDDRIFCFLREGKVAVFGLPRPLKLRREAAIWFEEFAQRQPTVAPNGEQVFYSDSNSAGSSLHGTTNQLHALIFLEQQKKPTLRMNRMQPLESRRRIEADLLAEAPEAINAQEPVLNVLSRMPCWRLQFNGHPQAIAEEIAAVASDGPGSHHTDLSAPGEIT